MLLLKILNRIHIPNYLLHFSNAVSFKLSEAYIYALNISNSYFKKVQNKFYTQFSFISYNPYMYPKYYSNSKKYSYCRKCFCFKYIILYRIYENSVEVLNIFHYRSNYKKVV